MRQVVSHSVSLNVVLVSLMLSELVLEGPLPNEAKLGSSI